MTDPIIEQARFLNDNAALEQRLAARKRLRDEPGKRGWMTRRGMGKA